jgi:hypothetical protein
MVRTQIQLTEEQAKALKELAANQHVSVAELIRRSVDALICSSASTDVRERRRRAMAASGRFRSGLPDIGINHDHYLAEDFQS